MDWQGQRPRHRPSPRRRTIARIGRKFSRDSTLPSGSLRRASCTAIQLRQLLLRGGANLDRGRAERFIWMHSRSPSVKPGNLRGQRTGQSGEGSPL